MSDASDADATAARESAADEPPSGRGSPPTSPKRMAIHALLFVATVLSTFLAGTFYDADKLIQAPCPTWRDWLAALPGGWRFAVPLMAILLVHELGHFIAARIHRVPASLPYFIPAPLLNPFGTMGAIIVMPDRIRRRDALLDIGAAGPLAGLCVAVPVIIIGIAESPVTPPSAFYMQEGQSLFYAAAKYLVHGTIPPGHDITMTSTAFAGWTGLFVTALNLIPVGQLDGGHIAYALFGPRWDRIARFVQLALLGMFVFNLAKFLPGALGSGEDAIGQAIGNSVFWLIWFVLLAVMRAKTGINHPPFDPGPLSRVRRAIAWACLGLFVLLFMPTPWASYGSPPAQEGPGDCGDEESGEDGAGEALRR